MNAGTSAQKRMERRLLKEAMTKGGEELHLALGAFDASGKQVCSSSVVVDKQVYTIVVSGSTVNIEDLTADTVVEDLTLAHTRRLRRIMVPPANQMDQRRSSAT